MASRRKKEFEPSDGRSTPRCLVIAGPNGAGKTTFARPYLLQHTGIEHFVNVDLIAAGLSPLRPEAVLITAGKMLLGELDRLVAARHDFAFESTLSGRTYAARMKLWKSYGYRLEMVYLKLFSPSLAVRRVAIRAMHGGHRVPREDVVRRFHRSLENFDGVYRPLADTWTVYDNSGDNPELEEQS